MKTIGTLFLFAGFAGLALALVLLIFSFFPFLVLLVINAMASIGGSDFYIQHGLINYAITWAFITVIGWVLHK